MPGYLDPDSFGFLITDIARLLRSEFDRRIAEAGLGLTPGEARALSQAARAGAVRQNALAEHMGVEAMTVCGYLDRLEARGLIKRTIDPSDRRAKLVNLTDEAETLLRRLAEISTEVRESASAELSGAELITLQKSLKQVRATLADGRGARSDVA